MTIKNQVTVKILIFIIISAVMMTSAVVFLSCKPELDFGDLVVCPEVDKDTFAPVEIKDIFETGVEKIYAVIEASGVKAEDVWKFTWENRDTGEVIADSTGSYSENDSGYMEGYLSNCIVPGEEGGIIGEPGNYRVDFYHNGQLISSADFIIEPAELKIIEVILSSEADGLEHPEAAADRFFPDDIINASIKLNCKIKGESIGIKWYRGEDELLGEKQFTIEKDYYLPSYIVFKITNEGPWPIDDYRIEIFHNESLEGNYNFEVVRKEISDAAFNQGNLYRSEEYKFSINFADDWSYEEEENNTGLDVDFTPVLDYVDVIIRMTVLKKGYFPGKEKYSDFADNIVKDIIVLGDDMEVKKTENTGEINDDTYSLINYSYPGEDENGWDIDLIFINKAGMLYLFSKISCTYYKGFADRAYSEMLNSLLFD